MGLEKEIEWSSVCPRASKPSSFTLGSKKPEGFPWSSTRIQKRRDGLFFGGYGCQDHRHREERRRLHPIHRYKEAYAVHWFRVPFLMKRNYSILSYIGILQWGRSPWSCHPHLYLGDDRSAKGAILTHQNLVQDARNIIQIWEISEKDVLLHALPLFHVHGLCFALHTSLIAGSKMVFLDEFSSQHAIDILCYKGENLPVRYSWVFQPCIWRCWKAWRAKAGI